MELVKGMNEELEKEHQFVYGGALNPKVKNIDKVIERVKQKKEAGALFLLTQPIYANQDIENIRLIKEATGIKILGGIMPLVSYKNAIFLHNEFPGMHIEEAIINRFSIEMTREEAEAVGVEIAISLANKMKAVVDGLYLMTPFNRATMIQKILRKIEV
jgi:homocysteine S-methyltransferase